ncbi:hypothetical protein [Limosilactobacillus reuteri]|uniref:hypothetical protein n=1 Tax=Limosilactobacillus reuteri TaxID=1598 RepID=UPI0021A3F4FC|nr:hypothetical protein [Limosilactobacillus reuteri]
MANRRRNMRGKRRTYERNIAAIRRRNAEYASVLADPKSRFKPSTSAVIEKSNIKSYLQRPADNFAQIAATLRQAYLNSGIVSGVIDYYVAHPTYNYSIYPVLGNKQYAIGNNMQEDYIDVAYQLNLLNINYWAPKFFKDTLLDGVTFYIKIEDSTGIAYMKLPPEWCRISNLENGVYRFRVDVSKLKQEQYDELPNELQQAFDKYHDNSISDDDQDWYDRKWYMVSDDGFAFTFDHNAISNGGVAISPFASVLADSLSLDAAKDNIDIKDKLDTIRIIHSKLPTDSNGAPTLDLKTARNFDDQMRSRLPDGVVSITSPSSLDNVPLKGSGNEGVYDTVNNGLEQLFYDLGISSSLFGGKTTSSNIVKESVKKDSNWIYTNLFPMLEAYYNFELSQVKTKSKIPWNLKFIRESNFTLKEDIANYKDQLSYGGSRLDYLASVGFTPDQIISQLTFEQQALDIDSIMVVKPTSNTISSKESSTGSGKTVVKSPNGNINNPNKGNVGRPETDNPTDDTDRLNDAA